MNTPKYIVWPTLLLVALLAMNSCKKSGTSSHATITARLDREGMQYIQAPVGTWFIYLDSASGNEDSVVVTQSEIHEQHQEEVNGPGLFDNIPESISEKYYLAMTKMGPGEKEEWLRGQTVDLCPCYVSFNYGDINLAKPNGDPLFYYSSYLPMLFTMRVNGIDYNNVHLTSDSVETRREILYTAKGVGIIKRISGTGANTKSWSLRRRS